MTNHVPTLETCQKLKAAGFPQKQSKFYFNMYGEVVYQEFNGLPVDCAAPLLTEILEELPSGIDHNTLALTKESGYSLGYIGFDHKGRLSSDYNPAEAAALLWLELREGNGL